MSANLLAYSRGLILLAVVAVLGGAAAPARAAVVQLSFSGTYNTSGGTVFGLSGTAVPYAYQLTYDTALDNNTFFFAAGTALGGDIAAHDWYGYSASGITAASLTFGSKTWTVAGLSPRTPAVGVTADLWFDTDLSVSAPSLGWAFFSQGGGSLQLGSGASSSGSIFMAPASLVFDPNFAPGAHSTDMSIEVVPEPGLLALLCVGAAAWFLYRPVRVHKA